MEDSTKMKHDDYPLKETVRREQLYIFEHPFITVTLEWCEMLQFFLMTK